MFFNIFRRLFGRAEGEYRSIRSTDIEHADSKPAENAPIEIEPAEIAPLLRSVPPDAAILEIGGGYNPRYLKAEHPNVYHLDHCSTQELRAKYAADPTVAHLIDNIQAIDFILDGKPIETLVPPDLRFDLIYGSHVLEHQVDLIGHLQSLEKLLRPGGRVIEVIPDLRTCFDALRYPSVLSDVLPVHMKQSPIHQGKQVCDFWSRYISKNLGRRMHDADFEDVRLVNSLRDAFDATLAAEAPGQPFSDIHAWTFTPESFRLLMIELQLLDLIQLRPTYVSPQYGVQFWAVLERPGKDFATMTLGEVQDLERERLALCIQLRFQYQPG